MRLLGQELFTDVTIASEGRRIKCHKVTVVSVKVPFREQPPPLHRPYFAIIKIVGIYSTEIFLKPLKK